MPDPQALMRTLALTFALGALQSMSAQDMLIYGTIKGLPDKEPITNGAITIEEGGVPVDATTSRDSGYYEFGLQLDHRYRIHYSAAGAIPKTLEIDLSGVDLASEDIEGGWGMNVDVTLYPEMDEVPDSLIERPFGRSAWNATDGNFAWDLDYTKGIRDAWSPWIGSIGERRIAPPQEVWSARTSAIVLFTLLMLAWRVYVSDRFDAWVEFTPHERRSPALFILPITAFGALGLIGWEAHGWLGWWAAMAATLSVSGALMLISKWRHFLGSREPEAEGAVDRTRATRVLNRMRLLGGIPALVCVFGLWSALDHTLRPEVHFVLHAALGAGLVLMLCLLFGGAIRRTFLAREDRVTFWTLCALFAVVLILGILHFADKELARPEHRRVVEITGLFENTGRRGKVTYEAHVLVEGRSKELHLAQDQWNTASDLDALELHIGRGPLGGDHILAWELVRRAPVVLPDSTDGS